MGQGKSQFLQSLGKLFSLFKKVADQVLARGGTDEDIQKIDTDVRLAISIAELLTRKAVVLTFDLTRVHHFILVDQEFPAYDETLQRLAQEAVERDLGTPVEIKCITVSPKIPISNEAPGHYGSRTRQCPMFIMIVS